MILSPGHKRWGEFQERLKDAVTGGCNHSSHKPLTRGILEDMGFDVPVSLNALEAAHIRGGFACDCALLSAQWTASEGPGELETVIRGVLAKYEAGELKYGPLDIETDSRDFIAEAIEELQDTINYAAMQIMRLRRIQGREG